MYISKFFAIAALASVSLFSAQEALAGDADIKAAIAGKTLVNGDVWFKARKNGRLTGDANGVKFKGAWTIRDGKWCRTFSEPEQWKGTECQKMELTPTTITIAGRNGPIVFDLK